MSTILQGNGNELSKVPGQSDIDSLGSVGAIQQTQTQYSTAVSVQKPRSLPEIEGTLLNEAGLAGDSFYYGWGAGKDRIEGASVDLAMSLIRTWGNCAIEMQPVQETYDAWVFTAAFVDLETGFTLMRQFRQSKTSIVYGKHDEARKEDIRFQIGQSKAIRNVVLNALPKWLAQKAIAHAKNGVRDKIESAFKKQGEDKVREAAIVRLEKHGVNKSQVLEKFGRPTLNALTLEDLVTISGDVSALDKGQDVVENIYPNQSKSKPGDDGGSADDSRSSSDKLADKIGVADEEKPQDDDTTAEDDAAPDTQEAPEDEQKGQGPTPAELYDGYMHGAPDLKTLKEVKSKMVVAAQNNEMTDPEYKSLLKVYESLKKSFEE